MNTIGMTRDEKKALLKAMYLNDYTMVKEVIEEIAADLELSEDLNIPDKERIELEKIVDEHFKKYAEVFKALA